VFFWKTAQVTKDIELSTSCQIPSGLSEIGRFSGVSLLKSTSRCTLFVRFSKRLGMTKRLMTTSWKSVHEPGVLVLLLGFVIDERSKNKRKWRKVNTSKNKQKLKDINRIRSLIEIMQWMPLRICDYLGTWDRRTNEYNFTAFAEQRKYFYSDLQTKQIYQRLHDLWIIRLYWYDCYFISHKVSNSHFISCFWSCDCTSHCSICPYPRGGIRMMRSITSQITYLSGIPDF